MSWAVKAYPKGDVQFFIVWEGLFQIGRMCVGSTDKVEGGALFVGSVYVEPSFRKQGISRELHNQAYLWAKAKGRRFLSGVINGAENEAYWRDLVAQGQAVPIETENGPMYERTG